MQVISNPGFSYTAKLFYQLQDSFSRSCYQLQTMGLLHKNIHSEKCTDRPARQCKGPSRIWHRAQYTCFVYCQLCNVDVQGTSTSFLVCCHLSICCGKMMCQFCRMSSGLTPYSKHRIWIMFSYLCSACHDIQCVMQSSETAARNAKMDASQTPTQFQ